MIHDPALCIVQSIAGVRNERERAEPPAPVTIAFNADGRGSVNDDAGKCPVVVAIRERNGNKAAVFLLRPPPPAK